MTVEAIQPQYVGYTLSLLFLTSNAHHHSTTGANAKRRQQEQSLETSGLMGCALQSDFQYQRQLH